MYSQHPLVGLQPSVALERFAEILRIPRRSKDEGGMIAFLVSWARRRGLVVTTDQWNNVVIHVPAMIGCEGQPAVCLQAHTDMVVGDISEEEYKKPIDVEVVNGWVQTKDRYRTLGADNAAGIILMLDVVDTANEYGPLYLLFTSDEEDDLTGVENFDPANHHMETCDLLINLDTPLDRTIGNACAGFKYVLATKQFARESEPAGPCHRIAISGLAGGHNGDNVGEGRGNALRILGSLLEGLLNEAQIVDFGGGSAGNAIPASAFALVKTQSLRWLDAIRDRFAQLVANVFIPKGEDGNPVSFPQLLITEEISELGCFTKESTKQAVDILDALDGVYETDVVTRVPLFSTTQALVKRNTDDIYDIKHIVRSAFDQRRDNLVADVKGMYTSYGCVVRDGHVENQWSQDEGSPLVETAMQAFANTGKPAKKRPFHCFMETGTLGQRYFTQAVSFGVLVENEHARSERMFLPSLVTARLALIELLRLLANS
jgi:dipeptidase D